MRIRALGILALLALACGESLPPPDTERAVDSDEALDWRRGGAPPRLRPMANGRHLETEAGAPHFLLADSPWAMVWKLSRSEVAEYLARRREEGFNAITLRAVCSRHTEPNAYRVRPYSIDESGEFDLLDPLTTPGHDPRDPGQYDYWDHLEYVLHRAADEGFHVLLSPLHGRFVSGPWSESSREGILVEDPARAYAIVRWVAHRYREIENVIWVVGQDRSPSTPVGEFTGIYDAIAEGIADGVNGEDAFDGVADYSTTLMTYGPRKGRANSSYWFHEREWLDFNSVQDYAHDQVHALGVDWSRVPPKPTFLYEGRYERFRGGWSDYSSRVQAYQTVFSGGFGAIYGNEVTYFFGRDWVRRVGDRDVWWPSLDDPGAQQMRHLRALLESLSDRQFRTRIPDPALVPGDRGGTFALESDVLVATRDRAGSFAWIYAASPRPFEVDLARLRAGALSAHWFDPRLGTASPAVSEALRGGPGAGRRRFTPPEGGPDWVLVLR